MIIEQDEAGYSVAEVPAFRRWLSSRETYEGSLANLREVLEGRLELMGSERPFHLAHLIEIVV